MEIADVGIVVIFVVLLVVGTRSTMKERQEIKERANREVHEELTVDELQDRLGEIELRYEDLEDTLWLSNSCWIAICTHLYWHFSWYVSIPIGLAIMFYGYKFLSVRPFTTGTPD